MYTDHQYRCRLCSFYRAFVGRCSCLSSHQAGIKNKGYQTPLIADVHFNPDIALKVADHADKVRINPGNFSDTEKFKTLLEKCRTNRVAIRIGVNHGSLSERIMNEFGDTPGGMAESAMEYLRICRDRHFDQVVVSMKASNVRVMVHATRLIAFLMDKEGMHFPLHLGVTEAGEGEDGRIKSAVGIGTLLAEGLGDTIRVSLTEEPEAEIPVARKLGEERRDKEGENGREGEGEKMEKGRDGRRSYEYNRRKSRVVGNIGGNFVPVVYGFDPFPENCKLIHAVFSGLTEELIRSAFNGQQCYFGIQSVLAKYICRTMFTAYNSGRKKV